jgi:hypothetical protein
MDIQYYYQLVVNGVETYWKLIVAVGGTTVGVFIVTSIKGAFSSKISGGSDWTKN